MNRLFGSVRKIHFVGIGGIGMSGIAEVLHNMGFTVTGSDAAMSANVERLKGLGIQVAVGHRTENAVGADVVVYTSAVKSDNPELLYAQDNYIPAIKRGEMLAELMRMKYAVAVAGSHGKTTTTSMVAEILLAAELDPTIIIGGRLNRDNNNASLGQSNIMVAEADESDRSFLMLYPSIGLITNIDYEHMEMYKDFDDVKQSFADFANRVPFYGVNIICMDDPNVMDIVPHIQKRFVTYGIRSQAEIRGVNLVKDGFSVSFDVQVHGEVLGRINLQVPGEHNVLNALAAIGAALEMKVDFAVIKSVLENFAGVQRRLSVRHKDDKCIVFDDYGHHPTEIQTTLKAIREAFPSRKVSVIFQPHRYSRTEQLMNEFAKCFFAADELFITDIYAASEEPRPGIDAHKVISEIKRHGFRDVHHLPQMDSYIGHLESNACENGVIITFGAGSITQFSHRIAAFLKGGKGE